MKKIYLALLLSLNLFAIALAKSPQTISYQAIVRGANGNIIQESNIGIKISILQNGDEVYSEERIEQSNKNGLLSFAIGDENGTSNQSIESIDWSKGNYTIRCEMDLQGGDNYSLSMTTPLTSVPYALYAETVSPDVLPKKVSELVNDKNFVSIEQLNTILNDRVNSKDNGAESEESPTITPLSIQLTSRDTAKWNAKLDNFTEQDPLFSNSVAAKISAKDTAKWNAKLDNFTEQDPLFSNSVAAKISAKDTAKWNAKLDNFTEQDPLFSNSVAAKISAKDTAKWNAKLDNFTEQDPLFSNSVAAKISAKDTAKWNAKLDNFTEQDPLFNNSVAAKISAKDTAKWNAKLDNFTEQDPLFNNSVAAKISAKDTAKWNAKLDNFTEQDPLFNNSVAAKISAKDTAKWNAKLDNFTEQDPLFCNSVAAKISAKDTAKWNAKLDDFTEQDPLFYNSVAAKISAKDTAKWNAKLDNFTEQDPLFNNSVAAKISAKDTAKWNAKLDNFTEQDPLFNNSVAAKISAKDTAKWNAKLDNFTEQDPLFNNSVAAKISAKDTAKWNAKLDNFTEQDPLFNNSVAAKISAKDTAKWNAKLDNFTEQDPLFNNSVAAKITKEDTNNWNAKLSEEKDPIYTKSPAASIKEQNIQQWNAKVDSTTYMNSAAAKITQNDVANWNAKLDASKLPANVSAFNNDAEYVKKQILNDSIKAISNRLGSTINTLQENNKQLSAKIKKLEEDYSELFETVNKIGNLTDKIAQSALAYRRAETTSYPLKFNNWNNTPDAYNALQDGDRIIFIIRHSIRSEESAFDSKLTKEGINLAKEVGAKLRGGKATANDAYYGSTNYPRCMQTSFYIAQSRGDSNWKDSSMVVNPISEILQTYYSSSTDWDYFAKLYEQSPEVTNDLSVKMINRLCQLSEGKTFAWFTTHDFVAVPLCSWASYGAINFKRPNWINFLTGVAVIVHPDNSWEVYPVKCNDSPYSSVSWYK